MITLSQALPVLSADEEQALRDSIQRDGVINAVQLDRHGQIIDGHHRTRIAAELGVQCPTVTLDVDDETADRYRIVLNVVRRQMNKADQYEMIAKLAERYLEEEGREAKQRMLEGGPLAPGAKGPTRDRVADRMNADMADLGLPDRVSGKQIRNSQAFANLPEETKQRVKSGEISASTAIKRQGKRAARPRDPEPPAANGKAPGQAQRSVKGRGPNRIVTEALYSLTAIADTLAKVPVEALDMSEAKSWLDDLTHVVRLLNGFRKGLNQQGRLVDVV